MAKAATKALSPLDGAARALEAGDVMTARREATRVLASAPDDASSQAARAFLERLRFPKRAFLLAGLALSLWVGMVLLAVFRG